MAVTTAAHQIVKESESESLPESFWEVVDSCRGALINHALSLVGNLEDAREVVQQTYCDAYRCGRQLAEAQSVSAFLRSINRSNALNLLRSRSRESGKRTRKAQAEPTRLGTTGGFSMIEVRESIAKAIESLPEKMRAAVVLRYWQQLSHKEIAERLEVPQGTVWHLLSEAYVVLHPKLNAFTEAPAIEAPPSPATTQTDGGAQS